MISDFSFVGFHSRVAALDRETGRLIWKWKCPKGSGYVSILMNDDRLIVSVQGYTYCLDPLSGQQIWFSELSGLGVGGTTRASARGGNTTPLVHSAKQDARQRQQFNSTM